MASTLLHPGERIAQHRFDQLSKPYHRAARFAALLLIAAGLSGCQSISMNSAQLRVIDASPDAGVIDSYQNSSALAYNLGFGTMTSYVPMTPGNYVFAADKAGTHQALVSGTDTLAPGKQYTEIVGGGLANMQQTVFQDQSAPALSGKIALRLINEATRAGVVDVYLVPLSGRLVNTSPIAVNLGYGANSGYIATPEGTYAIDVVPTGTVPASSTVTLLSGEQVAYASGSVRTIVLIDQETPAAQHAALSPSVQAIVGDDADAQ